MFAGVATATYLIKFDKKFQAANVTCEGALFDPGVNPIRNPELDPLFEFTCGIIGVAGWNFVLNSPFGIDGLIIGVMGNALLFTLGKLFATKDSPVT